jgi:pimeloyl-ACP methyl ester carboxylesterase
MFAALFLKYIMGRKKDRKAPESAWIGTVSPELVSITSRDGLKLAAFFKKHEADPSSSPNAMIYCHGFSGGKWRLSSEARFVYEDLGYSVLLPDARGYGDSEGSWKGMGWLDRFDLLDWVKWLQGRGAEKVALLGWSMGAALVMNAAGEAGLPSCVRAVVEDCGFGNMFEEILHLARDRYHLPQGLVKKVDGLSQKKLGFSFKENAPALALKAAGKRRIPFLFIHGEADTYVPFDTVHRLYDSYTGPKELFTVPGARHAGSARGDWEGYKSHIASFLNTYMGD